MARFSVGVDEGPSLPKRQRIHESSQQTSWHQPQDEEDDEPLNESEEEDDDDEEEEEEEEGEEGDEGDDDDDDDEEQEEETTEVVTNQIAMSNVRAPIGPTRNGGICVTLTDPEVLDCPVCYESLTIPVFQCENGHTACSSCCKKLLQKCPTCSLPIGYNRCRAIEKVLESVRLSCQNLKYGCKEIVNYSKKVDHEKICSHAPCFCPSSGCSFVGSSRQIYQHFSNKHKGAAVLFRYGNTFPVFFTLNDKSRILREEKEGVLFILNNTAEVVGNIITVSCIGPSSPKGGYFYELAAKMEGSNLKFQSFTKNIRKVNDDDPHSQDFLVVPASFFGSYGQISLDLCIWRYGTCPANIQRNTDTNAQRNVLFIQRSTGANTQRITNAV
ncbi:hypothetical protein JCGZ_02506 [Jatropha curcas]|uniref:RING-type E3 ubiquitin transferase n=1 Tax=Jatropha curcas TaxID=180498 RepID=A0A067JT13_JATCU|nr:E3 ubiquitin-protein ligase SINA-like 10 [Jatropha curcas]KDP22664.1 hypothetical protein JCGZ_02506 [Jatropha curcas]